MFGSVRVSDIDADLVMRVLDPIWQTKTETATRLRGRIEAILDWAAVRGHRRGDNPARWRGHLQKALPTIKKSLRVKHHPALPFVEMAQFMKRLADQAGVSARALEFCILTATRTGETINARWSEIDLNNHLDHSSGTHEGSAPASRTAFIGDAFDTLRYGPAGAAN